MFADELQALKRQGWRYVALQVLNFAQVIASGLMLWKGLGLVCNTESPIVVVLSGSMEPGFHRGDILFLTNPASTDYASRYETGDITVYKLPQGGIPIVHRVIEARDVRADECPELVPVAAEELGTTAFLSQASSSASAPSKSTKEKREGDSKAVKPDAEVLGAGGKSVASVGKHTREACRQLLLTKGDNNAQDDIALYGHQLKWLERRHIVGRVRGFLPYIGYVTIAMNDFPQLKYALLGVLGFLALVQRE